MSKGTAIKNTRVLAGITLEDVAKDTGISIAILNDIEEDRAKVSVHLIEVYISYLKALGWTVDFSSTEEEEEYIPEVENKFTEILLIAKKERLRKQKETLLFEQRLMEKEKEPVISFTGRRLRK